MTPKTGPAMVIQENVYCQDIRYSEHFYNVENSEFEINPKRTLVQSLQFLCLDGNFLHYQDQIPFLVQQ